MNQVEAPVRQGDMLAGKYRVEKVLGVGAMGVVVAAMHVDLQEMRAIKFMLPSMLGDAEGVERFLREARAAVRLKSQHVARINDVGRLDTGAPYIVMEYLTGSDLKAVLDARGSLPVIEAVGYMIQVCEALAEAHRLGIVHRDLKPANLFVTTGATGAPCVKVLDFGIAKVPGAQGQAMDMTRTSELLGTPLYMSPEQMRSTRNVDARSDIWALGVILYRMLTGKTPFTGSTVTEICSAVIADSPDPPAILRPDVPAALGLVVMRCLEKSPAKRFATADELSAALAAVVAAPAARSPAEPTSAAANLGRTVLMDPPTSNPSPRAQLIAPAPPPPPPPPVHAAAASAPLQTSGPQPQSGGISPGGSPSPEPQDRRALTAPDVAGAMPGQSTAQASTWQQSTAPAPATKASTSRGALVIVAVVAVVLGGGALLGIRMLRSNNDVALAAPAVASAQATTEAAAPSTTAPVEPVAPVASLAPVPAAVPASAASVAATAPVHSSSPIRAPHAPDPPPKKDSFGNDRK